MEIKVDRNIYSDSCISKVVYLLSDKYSIERNVVDNYEILTITHKTDEKFDVSNFWDKMNDLSAPKEVSLKELIKSGDQVDSISLGVGDRMAFEPVLRKYGITYAIKKDRTQNPPTYHFFFKAKDATVLKMAFQEVK